MYEPAPRDALGYDERRERAAWLGLLAYGPDAISVGTSAIALHRLRGLPVTITPQVTLPGGRSAASRDGIRVRHFDRFEVWRCGSRRVAAPLDALVQGLPDLPRENAVGVLDLALNAGAITADDVASVRERMAGRRGAV
ncbi:MAG TPA: hypothetical protein VNR62_01890, partial [Cellulomonas sp.]|nr:hypothetical protein [Cellulomonas sp.]